MKNISQRESLANDSRRLQKLIEELRKNKVDFSDMEEFFEFLLNQALAQIRRGDYHRATVSVQKLQPLIYRSVDLLARLQQQLDECCEVIVQDALEIGELQIAKQELLEELQRERNQDNSSLPVQ